MYLYSIVGFAHWEKENKQINVIVNLVFTSKNNTKKMLDGKLLHWQIND